MSAGTPGMANSFREMRPSVLKTDITMPKSFSMAMMVPLMTEPYLRALVWSLAPASRQFLLGWLAMEASVVRSGCGRDHSILSSFMPTGHLNEEAADFPQLRRGRVDFG